MSSFAEVLELLRCPETGQRLKAVDCSGPPSRPESGWLISEDGQRRYPIRNSVPRFVPPSNYADNFGVQWNRFARTQLDSHSGQPISAQRFWDASGWRPADLDGRWVLDVGCGAGRFAEVALGAGAKVVAVDYSSAVDACIANLGHHPNLHVVQADIYALPFVNGAFPFVYSLGVLQHTPDVARAFAALPPTVAPGGRLCVDFYHRSWKSRLLPKYWLRPFTTRMQTARLFSMLQILVPRLLPISHAAGRLPLGHVFKRIVPVADPIYFYERAFGRTPLTPAQRLEWALLDTFDWLSPKYDQPQTIETIRRWMQEAGLRHVEVCKAGHMVGRGTMA